MVLANPLPLPFSLLFLTGKVNEKIDFKVDARNAGRGKLTGKLTGVKYHTDVEVRDLKDGTYACHYLVPQPGAYVLSLMWNGQHIPDSPYKVTIKEAQVMKASSCLVEGRKINSSVVRGMELRSLWSLRLRLL